MNKLDWVENKHTKDKKNIPSFKAGDQVKVHVKIKEGNKERVQVFEGTVIKMRGGGVRSSFTVRKVSYGVGVERVFPIHSPVIEKIEVVNVGKVRRAKLYYLRKLAGRKARITSIDQRQSVNKDSAADEAEEVDTDDETSLPTPPAEAVAGANA